ncbi:hypothetical protein NDU88_002838, partial [Pleurodeles waltl]
VIKDSSMFHSHITSERRGENKTRSLYQVELPQHQARYCPLTRLPTLDEALSDDDTPRHVDVDDGPRQSGQPGQRQSEARDLANHRPNGADPGVLLLTKRPPVEK